MKRIATFIVTLFSLFSTGIPAIASPSFTVSAPASIEYSASSDGFAVSGISLSNAPSYVQVGLTLTDTNNVQVDAGDIFRVSVANQCLFDSSWTNSDTGGIVTISGDDSTNVIVSGNAADVESLVSQLWIYRQDSSFCSRGAAQGVGQNLLLRKLQVSAIESQPGLFWSPSTQHYYMLATQTTDDGMGQPTDDNGQVTDSSRYFVKWTTARAEAKATSINIGGNNHNGYLAAITTKDEFAFLNDNVTGGSGTLYPAWVGGSDAGTEGTWKWVDGPEAKQFGGDSLDHSVTTVVDPGGRTLLSPGDGYYIAFGEYQSWQHRAVLMRDSQGNVIRDSETGYLLALNTDDGNYCSAYYSDREQAWSDYVNYGPEIDTTPYGSTVRCELSQGWYWWGSHYVNLDPVVIDGNGNETSWVDNNIFYLANDGNYARDSGGNYLVSRIGTNDFSSSTAMVSNYDGATFWGQDSGYPPDVNYPDYCTGRGARGICIVNQQDTSGSWQSNNYYVYWSNGDRSNYANWNGTGSSYGDGAYSPQPDNASLNGIPGENALIINWCTRNASNYSNSSAVQETLYGNSDYHCTPGWNDLAGGAWGGASATYPNGYSYDTPNQIGTTDYVVEFCGYSDEASCASDPGTVAQVPFSFSSNEGCPQSASNALGVSFSAPNVDATELNSPTMVTETFDSIPTGWASDQMTKIGYMSGSTYIGSAGPIGGSGGTGSFPSAQNTYFTMPTTECYIGFWWSAGNAQNYVELMDSNNNVLASFSASDLVNALGSCPNSYCGNPNDGYQNGNELYAYVHLRLPSGFQKAHFFGTGFELDNISISVSIPDRSNGETNLSGPTQLTLDTPQVILVDPRASQVNIPGLRVSGDTTATVCFRQVADAEGNALDSSPTVGLSDDNSDPVTTQTINNDYVISGNTTDVESSASHLLSASVNGQRIVNSGPVFFKIFAVSGANPNSSTCDTGTSKIVEIRPIELDLSQTVDANFATH